MPLELTFSKTGAEIKVAIGRRIEQLQSRLNARNRELERLMEDKKRLRSYLVRSTEQSWGSHRLPGAPPSLYSSEDISSEERDEIKQLCSRISEIEQEIRRLTLIRTHLDDDQAFKLPYPDLVAYGFESNFDVGDN
jgi:hypothetical protein